MVRPIRIRFKCLAEKLKAGITLDDISGTCTSVYCGSFSNDYGSMVGKDLTQYPKHAVTGLGNSILSNRISYFYNLHGPSLTIDTACSSSLTCFHLGNQSLQNHESEISIVAGSALHFEPNLFITMSDFGMLSSDGRSRTFDARYICIYSEINSIDTSLVEKGTLEAKAWPLSS